MPTFYARRRGQAIVPNSRAAAEEMMRLPEGVAFRVDARVPRNGKHHRLVWALFSLTARALNDGPVPSATEWGAEDVARLVKLATGHVETFRLRPADAARYGTPVGLMPASIAYDAMDETAFGRFSDAAFRYIATDLCPWIRSSPVWPEIREILTRSRVQIEEAVE